MPQYRTVTPTFNPISLDEYLKVPTMIYNAEQKQEEKLDEYKNKLSKARAWYGDDPRIIPMFKDYDTKLRNIADNLDRMQLGESAKRLRDLQDEYRDFENRTDLAREAYAAQQKRFEADPTNIGSIGTPYDYYNNLGYVPSFSSMKDLDNFVGTITKNMVSGMQPQKLGYLDENNKQALYGQGFTQDELNQALVNAAKGQIDTPLAGVLASKLKDMGYDTMSDYDKQRVLTTMQGSLMANGLMKYSQVDELKYEQERSQIANNWLSNRINRENLPESWNDVNITIDNEGGMITQHYEYKSTKSSNNYILVQRRPVHTNQNGKLIVDGGWEPAPSYVSSDGTKYYETNTGSGTGMYYSYKSTEPTATTTETSVLTLKGGREVASAMKKEFITDNPDLFEIVNVADIKSGSNEQLLVNMHNDQNADYTIYRATKDVKDHGVKIATKGELFVIKEKTVKLKTSTPEQQTKTEKANQFK